MFVTLDTRSRILLGIIDYLVFTKSKHELFL
jgi:hypothetical protein